MKKGRNLVSLLLTVLMICSFAMMSVSAEAADTGNYNFKDNSDFMQNIQTVEDGLKVFCATRPDFPTASDFRAWMDGESVDVLSLDSAKDEPVTYLCLVDVSGSIIKEQLMQAKQMLDALCDTLDSNDQLMIATLSDKLSMSGYLTDKNEIHSRINNILKTENDTNLYSAIIDCLEELNTNEAVTPRRCLVIFSDGLDDITADKGTIWAAARDKVLSTRIPVYTMLPRVGDDKSESQKNLASLSTQYSVGGEAYFLAENKYTEEKIGKAITADMKDDRVLRLDLTGYSPKEEEFLLAVEYTGTTGNTCGDTLRIVTSVLTLTGSGSAIPGISGESSNIVLYSSSGGGDIVVDNGPDWHVWLKYGVGALCILLAVLVAWLIWKKNRDEKKKQEEEERQRRQQEEMLRRRAQESAQRGGTAPVGAVDNWKNAPPPATVVPPANGGRPVRFTAVNNQSFNVDMSLAEGREATVGRSSSKSNFVLNRDDAKLSGKHFALMLKNGRLLIRDAGSTNGTAVNGVPLKGNGMELHSGDTISVGSYQYRVRF